MKNLLQGKFLITFILLTTILAGGLFIVKNYSREGDAGKSIISQSIPLAPALSPTPTFTPVFTPTPSPVLLKKSTYSIAIFGDSMIDTMGENLEYLQKTLASKYPNTSFKLYNYGIGGQNIEQGLARFESSFVNRERNYPPIPALNPDILIIGSFAYNPFSTHDRNRHYALLRDLLARAKTLSSKIYLLAEIAPLRTGFGAGKNGVNMSEDTAYQHALNIIEQLDDVINLSAQENVPIINAYYASGIEGKFGDPYYVNQDDGIHPSFAGHVFTAEIIAAKVKFD
ncbi:MAG: hypothetical protein A3H79_01720 [Candidatus Levybacteria bacterium RIFCSPLOWO2_02_FULL_36_8b]|nr:MAG: hypothetical protein A3H79_01720 [Candidatus Levybacteria bacterium RIFCSPLOWO2_02_FULL_36_8b]